MKKLIAVVLLGLVLIGCGQESKTQAAVKPADYMTIGMKPEEFKAAFNRVAEINKSEFRISALNVTQGTSGLQFLFQFNSNIGVLGTINANDGTIRSLTTIATGDGSPKSGMDMVLIMHDMIGATNPPLSKDDTAKVAMSLFQRSIDNMGQNFEDVRNGIRYAAIFQKGAGLLFVTDQKR